MRSIKLLLASGIVATALVSTTATSALGQSTTIKDLRADVVQYDGQDDESGTVLDGPTSIGTGLDATSARVKHTKKSIAVLMRFSNLTTSKTYTYAGIRVKGSKKWPNYWIFSNGSKKKATVYDRKFNILCTVRLTTRTGSKGSINVVVPRKCVKNPKSIKVQTGVSRYVTGVGDPASRIYDESISATRYKTTTHTKWLRSS